ncbi:MAG: isoprenylcysteine carboxylmethyltransferase family protein [Phycisphaerales bacterium]
MFSNIAILAKINPELLNQRGAWKKTKNTKWWDKWLILPLFGILGFYAPMALAGLDVGRFGWSNLGPGYAIFGIIIYAAGTVLITWAMIINRHFEASVRIQTDRQHKVVSEGPYRVIRHPGYVGAIVWVVCPPLIIGSLYGLIPAAMAAIVLIVRTILEDKILQKELDGYADYAKVVRYRLIPGVW